MNNLNENRSGKHWLTVGALLAGLSVVTGAFGAHTLASVVQDTVEDPEKSLGNWETASRYHMYHSIAIIVLGICFSIFGVRAEFKFSGACFVVGILVFSGLLYTLALTDIKILGAIVPLGGLAMIAGWFFLAVGIWRTT